MFQRRRFKARRSGNSAVTSTSKGSYYDQDSHNNGQYGGVPSSLANFDACVEACDAIAASSGSSSRVEIQKQLKHSESENQDTSSNSNHGSKSIMISPDGELLSCSNHDHSPKGVETDENEWGVESNFESDENGHGSNYRQENNNSPAKIRNAQLAAESRKEEFESSIFIGNDVVPDGEKVLNGFSAR